ncbi:6569_t:CDS:1 [Cetraspora pellucida]|uniref:6569_t:CDS:1 n=1 Tax=Cetraspora pellucida TaxID=1433469 RepID=A0A9N8WB99_9GLOM|nr:6569_t:CDS:1 [Cetraspora pellucida]
MEKSQPAPYLPPETLVEIFRIVGEYNIKSLYPCLLVNKLWCESAALMLWKKPFEVTSLRASAQLVSIYFLFFSQETKDTLLNMDRIDVSHPTLKHPKMDYLAYLRYVDFNMVYRAVRMWVSHQTLNEPFHSGLKKIQSKQSSRIVEELGKLFTNGSSLYKISLNTRSLEYIPEDEEPDYRSWPCYSARNSMSELREFVCGGQFAKDNILQKLAELCNEIEIVSIYDSCGTSPQTLINFIKAQKRLKQITLTNWQTESFSTLTSISTQVRTFKHIEFIQCNFPTMENGARFFCGLAKCSNLQVLKFEHCDNLNTTLMRPLAKAEFPSLRTLSIDNVFTKDAPSMELKSIIENCKETLKEIVLRINLTFYTDMLETIAKFCPGLHKLNITIERDSEMQQLITLFRSCKELIELIIHRRHILFDLWFLPCKSLVKLGGVIPPSLRRLELIGIQFDHQSWNEFLNICPGSINYFVFDHPSTHYVKHVENYATRHNKIIKAKGILEHSSGQFFIELR